MKLLIFEYATATRLGDPSITAEGRAMLDGLLEDLDEYTTYNLIPIGCETPKSFKSQSVPFIGDLKDWIRCNINQYDACIFIAPEENNLLYDLTRIIEEQDVEIIGSNSEAVKKTTNKYDMCNELNGKVPIIKTEKIYFTDCNEKLQEQINKLNIGLDKPPKVIKPADGVSCSGVNVVNSLSEFMTAKNQIKMHTQLPYFIIQDYIQGVNVSVSLLSNGETAVPLSLNFQDMYLKSGEINYNGGKVPFEHELSDIAMETAKNAVKSIDGIKGYVGVDMILDDEKNQVYVVEVNSRVTTPYVALRRILNFNLGEAMINSVHGELPTEIELNGQVQFYKEGKTLRVSVLK